jgi:hypothetical protein
LVVVVFDTAKVEYNFYSAKKNLSFFNFICIFLPFSSVAGENWWLEALALALSSKIKLLTS